MEKQKTIWFKRKTYGWGWTPVTWQGWALTAGYALALIACGSTLDEGSSRKEFALAFVLPVAILTTAFMRIAYKRGESPRWQWGKRSE